MTCVTLTLDTESSPDPDTEGSIETTGVRLVQETHSPPDLSRVAGWDAFEHAPYAYLLYLGPELRIGAANAEARRLFHRPLVGRTLTTAFPELAGTFVVEALESVLQTGLPMDGERWRGQFVPALGDGSHEVWLTFRATPVRDPEGTIHGVAVQLMDVTGPVLRRDRFAQLAHHGEVRYRASREVVAELQHAMLPVGLPVLPRLDLAASYLVAGTEQAAGGDWFDAVCLDDGTVALVVGDVVGHGVQASVAMGQLRTVLLAHLRDGVPLEDALQRVERFAAQTPGARAATAVVAVVDPLAGTLSYATCGHPPPLVVASDGTARYLPLSGGGPLGLGAAAPLAHDVLGAGDVLVLYSDGLIERSGRTLDEGLADLAAITGDVVAGRVLPLGEDVSPTERACRLTTELMLRQAPQADDVTVLTAGVRARDPGQLSVTLPARPASLARLRAAADAWLACLGLRGPEQAEFMLVVTEAATNAIEHAYRPDDLSATFDVEARLLRDGTAAICVTDHGTWGANLAGEAGRGRGLMIMKELTADLNVIRRPTGTTVELWQRLVRPVVRGTTGQLRTTRQPRVVGLEIARFASPPGSRTPVVLRCSGTLDGSTSPQLSTALEGTGPGPIVVDLTDLDLLSSAGVRVLAEQGADLVRLVAAPGSPARAVLDLVQIPAADSV